VRIYPQPRTLVTPIDTDAIREAQFMRIALETEVVRKLAEHSTREALARLHSILSLQVGIATQPEDIQTFQELDEMSHQTLFAVARHDRTQRIMRSHAGHLERHCQVAWLMLRCPAFAKSWLHLESIVRPQIECVCPGMADVAVRQ
jgi:DNA-binding GntR family transcriptional regulator